MPVTGKFTVTNSDMALTAVDQLITFPKPVRCLVIKNIGASGCGAILTKIYNGHIDPAAPTTPLTVFKTTRGGCDNYTTMGLFDRILVKTDGAAPAYIIHGIIG